MRAVRYGVHIPRPADLETPYKCFAGSLCIERRRFTDPTYRARPALEGFLWCGTGCDIHGRHSCTLAERLTQALAARPAGCSALAGHALAIQSCTLSGSCLQCRVLSRPQSCPLACTCTPIPSNQQSPRTTTTAQTTYNGLFGVALLAHWEPHLGHAELGQCYQVWQNQVRHLHTQVCPYDLVEQRLQPGKRLVGYRVVYDGC